MMFKKNYKPKDFDKLSEYILNNIVISVPNISSDFTAKTPNIITFRICEIEFYYYNEEHKDEYVHKDSEQKSWSKFYFHKFRNGTFKAGTFKGIDITLGNKNTYFGILIRSVQDVKTKEFIEGSCNCVNKLLTYLNVANVKELFEKHYDNNTEQININDSKLNLSKMKLEELEIYKGPRIGLSDKYPEYKDKLYRYATNIQFIKKQRKTFAKCEKEEKPMKKKLKKKNI